LPSLLLTCIAGDRTPSLLPSFSSTAKTASPSVRVPTSMLCSPTRPTLVPPMLVSTATPSLFALRSTSLLEPATSPVLTTPPFSLFFPTPPSLEPTLPRSVSTPPTTTFFVLCREWVGSHTQIKL